MSEVKKVGGRFAGLRALKEKVDEQLEEVITETSDPKILEEIPTDIQEQVASSGVVALSTSPLERTNPKVKSKETTPKPIDIQDEKRGPGRPRGRRSNPDYTQVSAYIPLDLLLDIQDELSQEKRLQRKRTAVSVSELVENLLTDWLKKQKLKNSK